MHLPPHCRGAVSVRSVRTGAGHIGAHAEERAASAHLCSPVSAASVHLSGPIALLHADRMAGGQRRQLQGLSGGAAGRSQTAPAAAARRDRRRCSCSDDDDDCEPSRGGGRSQHGAAPGSFLVAAQLRERPLPTELDSPGRGDPGDAAQRIQAQPGGVQDAGAVSSDQRIQCARGLGEGNGAVLHRRQ